MRRNAARLFCEISLANLYSKAPILHTMRITTIIDIAMTEIRVALFDMVKQKSNSAIKNVAMLSRREGVHKLLSESNSPKAAGDLRPHEQCPRETENYSHRFKTEGLVTITVEIRRLPKCYLGKHVRWDCPLTAAPGSFRPLVMWRRSRGIPTTMLPILACTDKQLAICVGDVKIITWLALVKLLPLIFDRTTPGMARKPTLTASITVDCSDRLS